VSLQLKKKTMGGGTGNHGHGWATKTIYRSALFLAACGSEGRDDYRLPFPAAEGRRVPARFSLQKAEAEGTKTIYRSHHQCLLSAQRGCERAAGCGALPHRQVLFFRASYSENPPP